MSEHNLHLETLSIHGGYTPDKETGAISVPIYQSTSFAFEDSNDAAARFALQKFAPIYSRLGNPTCDVLEKRIALLDGGAAALAVSSGMAAISLAILTIAQSGDEIVASESLYGGTATLFEHTLKRFGIKTKFVDTKNLEQVKSAINEKTKLLYAETIGNPKGDVINIEELAEIAHSNGIPLIVDNTVTTPVLLKPIDYGADIVVYSATKFLGGHGTTIAGLIVDSGKFDWEQNNKFPLITSPDPSYHNLKFVDALRPVGNIAYIIKARVNLLRDTGPALSPFNAFLILQGIETLSLRIERHCENTLKVAKFLESHPAIESVNYPGLPSSKYHALAKKYLP